MTDVGVETVRMLGRFTVEGKLGEGGMGVVYRGYDPQLDREVAIKLVGHGHRDARERLMREAMAMARVAHPNVVPVYEVGNHGEQLFVAMEMVRGATLTHWLAAEARPWRTVLRALVDAGRGLAAAHHAGILHRDFKPDNVLIGEDGRARVVDFGLARAVGVSEPHATDEAEQPARVLDQAITRHGAVVGTPGFMSPEHFEGNLSQAADQWSFAVTAYVALFGEMPFASDDDDLYAIRATILTVSPRVPALDDIAPEVADAILRGLAVDPIERFPSLDAMLEVFEQVLAIDPEEDQAASRRQRRRLVTGFAIAAALFVLVSGLRTDFRWNITTPQLLAQGIFAFLVGVACAVIWRRTLWKAGHNRRVMSFFLIAMGTLDVHRMLSLDQDAVAVLRTDAVIDMALLLVAAINIERWFLASVGVMGIHLALSFIVPAPVAIATFPIALIGTGALGIWFWREPELPRLAKQRHAAVTVRDGTRARSYLQMK